VSATRRRRSQSRLTRKLKITNEETLRRHQHKMEAMKYGEPEMRRWYRQRDLLPGEIERVITAESSLDDTVRAIMADTGLDGGIAGA
jgi:hypothetical protein